MKYKSFIFLTLFIFIVAIVWSVFLKPKPNNLINDTNSVLIGGQKAFKLYDNDELIDLKSNDTSISNFITTNYWYLYTRDSDQVLNQIIKGENDFFIWLSSAKLHDFIHKQKSDTSLSTLSNKKFFYDNTSFLSFFMKRKDKFINRTIFESQDNTIIIIDNIDFDSLKINTLHNDTNNIIKRI